MPFKLTWLPTVLKDTGLKVAETDGWINRGRREMGTVKGVICHHTVGPRRGNMPSLGTLIRGTYDRSGRLKLKGPLSQLGLGRDGTYYIIAAGLANHAGVGKWENLTGGNSQFIGIEAENVGTAAEPWPAVQLDAYHRGVAAILSHIGADPIMCCGHKEWALPPGRKPDPHTIDMGEFRSKVAAIMDNPKPALRLIPDKDPEGRPTQRRGSVLNRKFLVKLIQKGVGFTGGQVDGIFGPLTEAAVRRFQRDHGLVPDGIVGPKTWDKLDSI